MKRCSFRGLRLGLAAALSSLTLVACIDQSGGANAPSDSAETAKTAASNNGPPVLQLMQDVHGNVAFRGVRRYITHIGPDRLEQIEDVGSDGQGLIGFELVQLVGVPPSIEPFGYEIEAENAWRFNLTLRDPRIVSAFATMMSYTVETLAATPTVAGIPCVRLSFERHSPIDNRPGSYEADVDPLTGFALAWREYDDSGILKSSVVYESFAYDGDLSDLQMQGRAFDATPVSLGQPVAPQVGFEVHLPEALGEGFEFVAAETMTVPDSILSGLPAGESSYLVAGEWFRAVATDGIETITFMHSANFGGFSAVTGELKISSERDWKIGYGHMGGKSFVCAGRMSMEQLRQIVASGF